MFSHSFTCHASPPSPLSVLLACLSQLRILKRYRGRTSTWALWMGSPRWRKKNSQRTSGLMWVCMHECASANASVPVCVCLQVRGGGMCGPKGDVGTNESTGAARAVCLLWQGDETNYVGESIIISLALHRHDSLLFTDSHQFVSVAVQVVQEGLHEDPLDHTQPVCTVHRPHLDKHSGVGLDSLLLFVCLLTLPATGESTCLDKDAPVEQFAFDVSV